MFYQKLKDGIFSTGYIDLYGLISLQIKFNNVNGLISKYGYLKLFALETRKYIYDKTRNLIGLMSSIKYKIVYPHSVKVKIDTNDNLVTDKTISISIAIALLRHTFNKNQNNSYCHAYLETRYK